MNWKVFLTAFVSSLLIAVPQNSFTCGPSEDPYDYYTSFFSTKAGNSDVYKPFYYTALLTFYDDWSQDSVGYENDMVIKEWMDYTKSSEADVAKLVYLSTKEEVQQLKNSVVANQSLPVSFTKNAAAKNLVSQKKTEAASYLFFAKKTEMVSASTDSWEPKKKDSLELNKYISEAVTEFAKATEPFVKTKWAFQRCKLSFYNNRFADCIRWYDEYFTEDNKAAVAQLALSYKAGSLFRSGKNKEAAYIFSKTFSASHQNKKSNFLGFMWATNSCDASLVNEYTTLAKNNKEKADMLALFALHTDDYQLNAMQKVYDLNPSSPLLPLLASREINKLEEQYFTPMLSKEPGGKALYMSWDWRGEDENGKPKVLTPQPVTQAAQEFEKLLNDKAISNRSFYGAAAAYLYFIAKDYTKAKALVAAAKAANPDAKVTDQLSLTSLLIAANEGKTITAETEAQLLPAMKWLTEKAKKDTEYALFCRNFFSQILAQKYEQQTDAVKAALAYGMADLSFIARNENEESYYNYMPAIDFVRDEMNTASLLKLYELTNKPQTETDKFLVQNSSVKRDAVVDVIGTSYLRDRDYKNAIEWLSKAAKLEKLVETQYNYQTGNETTMNADPLHDYLNDWQRFSKTAIKPYTKLSLAQKLLELQKKADGNAPGDKSKTYYQLASAFYNMSYYGNSWNAVAYNRSSSDWNEGVYKQAWQKEYYGVFKAREYYQKAYELATDKEFKAAALFMVAKCAQRQIPRPAYDYTNYEQYDKNLDAFYTKFMTNPLFAKFKTEFGTTKFYQYTYNRCSYLRDYIKKGSTPVKTTPKPKSKG